VKRGKERRKRTNQETEVSFPASPLRCNRHSTCPQRKCRDRLREERAEGRGVEHIDVEKGGREGSHWTWTQHQLRRAIPSRHDMFGHWLINIVIRIRTLPLENNQERNQRRRRGLTVGLSLANPKSVILNLQSRETRRFPGFKSLDKRKEQGRGGEGD
jgi:hypothetical protein